jgi:hypothetical protein
MSQYPIVDKEDLIDGVNYLLSGPSGLGQNFQGFSSYTTAYLTGNYRTPFTQTTVAVLYESPIALSTSESLDPRTFKFTFASTQPTAPFPLGAPIIVSGVNDSFYNDSWAPIGVIACTTDYVIVRTQGSYPGQGVGTGGQVYYSVTEILNSTDCNARVTVFGGTDRVFISAQLNNIISYTCTTSSDLSYVVSVNRYIGSPNNDPVNPDYVFDLDETVSQRTYTYTGLTGTGVLNNIESIFTTVIDQPNPGYYWYILEVEFIVDAGDVEITQSEFGLRSLSAQVVKE